MGVGEEVGWLEGMQRACRKRETSGLKANIKIGAADVRLNVESQIQKALFDECEARLTTRGRSKRPSINGWMSRNKKESCKKFLIMGEGAEKQD